MNTGKFLQTLRRARQRFPPNLSGKLTLNLTTIRNFNTKTSSTHML